jgi:hypothetical protein
MIDDKVFVGNAEAQREVQDYYKRLSSKWKRLVKAYYNRREDYWGRAPTNGYSRTIVLSESKRTLTRRGAPRLADALIIRWDTMSGRVSIYPQKIMVRGGKSDLATILSIGGGKGTKTPKAYKVEVDYRIPAGQRQGHDITVWTRFMQEFVTYADSELEHLADHLTELVADSIEQSLEEF